MFWGFNKIDKYWIYLGMYFDFLLLPLSLYPNGLIHSQLRFTFTFPSLSCQRYFLLIPKTAFLTPWFSNHSSKEQGCSVLGITLPTSVILSKTEDGISLGWNLTELQRKKQQHSLCVPWYGGRIQNARGGLRPCPTLLDCIRNILLITKCLYFSSSLTMLITFLQLFCFLCTWIIKSCYFSCVT